MSRIVKLGRKKVFKYPKSIKEVDELTGEEFEMFIFRYLKEFENLGGELTEKNDYGVDILLWDKNDEEIRYGAQCKRYGPKTILGENDLMKMQKGVTHYGLSKSETGKPFLMLFTSAEKNQVSARGLAYIENEEIDAYYRDDIIEILKDLDEKLKRDVNQSNYNNIAFESSKKKKESFRENSKFVDMLKKERKNISKYNKLFPLYLVYNDHTLEDIVLKKPTNIAKLSTVKGFDKKKIDLFGEYLVNKIRIFLDLEKYEQKVKLVEIKPVEVKKTEIKKEDEFERFLKDTRKKIASFNKITPLYNVFNNKTLEAIMEEKPTSVKDLKGINGFGPAKIELFGSYLIKEIKKYLDQKN